LQALVGCWGKNLFRIFRIGLPVDKLSDYVMTKEAAEILGVSQNTVRAWAEDGRIPMHRNPANGYRMFRRKDLQDLLAKAATPVWPARKRSKK